MFNTCGSPNFVYPYPDSSINDCVDIKCVRRGDYKEGSIGYSLGRCSNTAFICTHRYRSDINCPGNAKYIEDCSISLFKCTEYHGLMIEIVLVLFVLSLPYIFIGSCTIGSGYMRVTDAIMFYTLLIFLGILVSSLITDEDYKDEYTVYVDRSRMREIFVYINTSICVVMCCILGRIYQLNGNIILDEKLVN